MMDLHLPLPKTEVAQAPTRPGGFAVGGGSLKRQGAAC